MPGIYILSSTYKHSKQKYKKTNGARTDQMYLLSNIDDLKMLKCPIFFFGFDKTN